MSKENEKIRFSTELPEEIIDALERLRYKEGHQKWQSLSAGIRLLLAAPLRLRQLAMGPGNEQEIAEWFDLRLTAGLAHDLARNLERVVKAFPELPSVDAKRAGGKGKSA